MGGVLSSGPATRYPLPLNGYPPATRYLLLDTCVGFGRVHVAQQHLPRPSSTKRHSEMPGSGPARARLGPGSGSGRITG